MAISHVTLENFRSYQNKSFSFDPGVTLIVGPNGSGKTNILEAVYVLATTRSFRARDEALIRKKADLLRVVVNTTDSEYSFAYQAEPVTKRISIDGAKKTLRGHIGNLPVVLFEPGDLQLLAGPPNGRRGYIDTILCQTDTEYLQALNKYKRTLRQRNALLREHTNVSQDMLFAWSVQLAGPGFLLRQKRASFITYLQAKLPDLYASIAGKAHQISIIYQPNPSGSVPEETTLLEYLEKATNKDSAAGFTTTGPHRDDFAVVFDGHPLAARASRGEHRSVVLALKLAELAYQGEFARAKPIFMLDDVFSELDKKRRDCLLKTIGDFQTIVTTTEADTVRSKHYYTIQLGGDNE